MSLLSCRRLGFSYPSVPGLCSAGDKSVGTTPGGTNPAGTTSAGTTSAGAGLISDLSLELAEGEILSFLGPSGCGKTTLLKLLSGFLRPEEGELSFADGPLEAPFPEGQMIFQDSGQLLPWLTVEENIIFPRRRRFFGLAVGGWRGRPEGQKGRVDHTGRSERKDSQDELKDRLDEVLEAVGLRDFRRYRPGQLSGGMKQRCALGRALMAEPRLLFLDEPFGSLDAPSRRELQNLLLSLWRKRKFSMIFVTHDIAEALTLSDRILLFGGAGPEMIDVNLPRPREHQEKTFRDMELELYSALSASAL